MTERARQNFKSQVQKKNLLQLNKNPFHKTFLLNIFYAYKKEKKAGSEFG